MLSDALDSFREIGDEYHLLNHLPWRAHLLAELVESSSTSPRSLARLVPHASDATWGERVLDLARSDIEEVAALADKLRLPQHHDRGQLSLAVVERVAGNESAAIEHLKSLQERFAEIDQEAI